jgi:hypothetical protein
VWSKENFFMIAYVLGKMKLEELCDLGVRSLWGFSKCELDNL